MQGPVQESSLPVSYCPASGLLTVLDFSWSLSLVIFLTYVIYSPPAGHSLRELVSLLTINL